jgi:hypothetical protein
MKALLKNALDVLTHNPQAGFAEFIILALLIKLLVMPIR